VTNNIYLNIKEVWALRRAAARYPEKWSSLRRDILDPNKYLIGKMGDPDMAALVVKAHNLLIPIINTLHMALKKLKDRRAMEEEVNEDPTP